MTKETIDLVRANPTPLNCADMTKISRPTAKKAQQSQEATNPHSPVVDFGAGKPLHLDSGVSLSPFRIAYQSYGELNADKSNAILVCHALTGDQHVANVHPVTGKPGWWELLIGPGKPIDTDRYFVLCSNVLGGCLGSTGPASINPETGKAYALDLPIITIADMVRAQAMLIEHLGIKQLFAVIGGSMGGMQVLEWASSHSDKVFAAVAIATGARHSSQNIAFHEVGRQAVMADPDWKEGRYLEAWHCSAQGSFGRPHGGAYHLSVRDRLAQQVRTQSSGPAETDLRIRRGFPD